MKLASIKDITDENLKEAKASEITSLLDSEIKKISDKFEEDKKASAKSLEEAKATSDKLVKTSEDLQKVQEQLNKFVEAQVNKEKEEKFSVRMEAWDSEYELDKEEKDAIASEIKDLNDEQYTAWAKKMNIFFKNKKKKGAKVDKEDVKDKGADEKTEAKASVEKVAEVVLDNAIDKGEKDKTTVAATVTPTETLADKAKKAFGVDNWVVKNKKNRI